MVLLIKMHNLRLRFHVPIEFAISVISGTLSKPSTALCTLEHYTAFLLAEAQSAGCVRLSEVSGGKAVLIKYKGDAV